MTLWEPDLSVSDTLCMLMTNAGNHRMTWSECSTTDDTDQNEKWQLNMSFILIYKDRLVIFITGEAYSRSSTLMAMMWTCLVCGWTVTDRDGLPVFMFAATAHSITFRSCRSDPCSLTCALLVSPPDGKLSASYAHMGIVKFDWYWYPHWYSSMTPVFVSTATDWSFS